MLKTIIAPVRERANELLEARGELPIAHLTPHTLRRTFASLLAVCGVHPRRAMQLLGHTDAKFTMSVYQQDLALGDGGLDTLENALGCKPRGGTHDPRGALRCWNQNGTGHKKGPAAVR